MLFSEPKIPQSLTRARCRDGTRGFSALQRAENSSIRDRLPELVAKLGFQCSSASRKFLNRKSLNRMRRYGRVSVLFSEPKIPQFICRSRFRQREPGFSALQRAENSSIYRIVELDTRFGTFQCSSASRKFLNETNPGAP